MASKDNLNNYTCASSLTGALALMLTSSTSLLLLFLSKVHVLCAIISGEFESRRLNGPLVMSSVLLGYDVSSISSNPFWPARRAGVDRLGCGDLSSSSYDPAGSLRRYGRREGRQAIIRPPYASRALQSSTRFVLDASKAYLVGDVTWTCR